MSFSITPEWVANLREDLETWDDRVERERESYETQEQWTWPELVLPLKYTGSMSETVSI